MAGRGRILVDTAKFCKPMEPKATKNTPITLEYLQMNAYFVRVVFIVNPHIIFIKRVARDGDNEDIPNFLAQIGISDILPSTASHSEDYSQMVIKYSPQWTPGSLKVTNEFISEAKEIYFLDELVSDEYKLFDRVNCVLGKLYLISNNGKIEELGEMLSKYTNTVYPCPTLFRTLYETKCLMGKPDESVISGIQNALGDLIKEQQNLNEDLPIDNSGKDKVEIERLRKEMRINYLVKLNETITQELLSAQDMTEERRQYYDQLRIAEEIKFKEMFEKLDNPNNPTFSSTSCNSQNNDSAKETTDAEGSNCLPTNKRTESDKVTRQDKTYTVSGNKHRENKTEPARYHQHSQSKSNFSSSSLKKSPQPQHIEIISDKSLSIPELFEYHQKKKTVLKQSDRPNFYTKSNTSTNDAKCNQVNSSTHSKYPKCTLTSFEKSSPSLDSGSSSFNDSDQSMSNSKSSTQKRCLKFLNKLSVASKPPDTIQQTKRMGSNNRGITKYFNDNVNRHTQSSSAENKFTSNEKAVSNESKKAQLKNCKPEVNIKNVNISGKKTDTILDENCMSTSGTHLSEKISSKASSVSLQDSTSSFKNYDSSQNVKPVKRIDSLPRCPEAIMKKKETVNSIPLQETNSFEKKSISFQDLSSVQEINSLTSCSGVQKNALINGSLEETNSSLDNVESSDDKVISDSEDPDIFLSDSENDREFEYTKYLTKRFQPSAFRFKPMEIKPMSNKTISQTSENAIVGDIRNYKITDDPFLNFDKYMSDDKGEINTVKSNEVEYKSQKLQYPQVTTQVDAIPAKFNDDDTVKQICTPKLMVHSKTNLPNPWLNLNEVNFTQTIHLNLEKMKINTMTSSQTTLWPIVTQGHNTLMIGPKGSGKTMGFLVPLCNFISDSNNWNCLPTTYGPLVWIVCSDVKSAMQAEKYCNNLLKTCFNGDEKISVTRIDSSLNDCEASCILFRGCSILISSPTLIKLINYEFTALDLKRLSFLLFDDIDMLKDKYSTEVIQIYKLCSEKTQISKMQVLASSRTWNHLMVNLTESIDNPVICINAFQECTLYSDVGVAVSFTKEVDKVDQLVTFLNNLTDEYRKSIVVCDSDEEVEKINRKLNDSELHVIKVTSVMNLDKILILKNQWNNHSNFLRKTVLVCCDDNVIFLNISNANCLVHFNISKSFFAFDNRFSTLIDNLHPPWEKSDAVASKVLFFITESNDLQMPKIIHLLRRYGLELSENINNRFEALMTLRDENKATYSMPLCNELMAFGKCPDYWSCSKRHTIVPHVDKTEDQLPQSGYINFKIIRVHNVCYYSARILSYINVDGTKINVEQNYLKLALDICRYYSKDSNRIPYSELNSGDICIAELKKNRYYRCRVVKITVIDKLERKNDTILINLIDQNKYVKCQTYNLFKITEDFKSVGSTVIQIRVAGLMPKDKEITFSENDNGKIAKLYSSFPDDMFVRGRIVLSSKNIFWIDNVQCCQPMSFCNRILVRKNVRKYILDENIGILNPEHMPLLHELCKKVSLFIPTYDLPTRKEKITDENRLPDPRWAFLDEEVFSEIYFSYGTSPSLFFVRIVKWQSCLNMLQKDIQKYVNALQHGNVPLHLGEFGIGQYYIAKHSDGEFYRCRIDEVDTADYSERHYTCFFVDFGETSSVKHTDIYPLSANLMDQMPFQAIECRILGIKPSGDEWTESAIDLLYDTCFESVNSDVLKIILAKYCLEEQPQATGSKKYAVLLFDSHSKESFCDIFVSKMLACYLDSEKSLIHQAKLDMNDHILYCLKPKESDKDETYGSFDSCTDEPDPKSALVNHSVQPFNKYDPSIVNIEDFEVEGESEDDEWDCTFTETDYKNWKSQNEPPVDVVKNSISNGPKLVEVPDNVNSTNLNEYFQRNCKLVGVIEMSPHQTPFVQWHQTKTEVILKIELVGVEDYTIKITPTEINFQCVLRGTEYKLLLNLEGGVDPDMSSHVCKGMYVSVKLLKLIPKEWYTLMRGEEKAPWLKFNYDDIGRSDDDDEAELNEVPDKSEFRKETLERLRKIDFEDNSDDELCEDDAEVMEWVDS